MCLNLNISAKSATNSTFLVCFSILRSSRIHNRRWCLLLSNISCRKTGKTNGTSERVRYWNSKNIWFYSLSPSFLYSFTARPRSNFKNFSGHQSSSIIYWKRMGGCALWFLKTHIFVFTLVWWMLVSWNEWFYAVWGFWWLTDWQTDICTSWVAFATENLAEAGKMEYLLLLHY